MRWACFWLEKAGRFILYRFDLVFLGGAATTLIRSLHCDFVTCIKDGVASLQMLNNMAFPRPPHQPPKNLLNGPKDKSINEETTKKTVMPVRCESQVEGQGVKKIE